MDPHRKAIIHGSGQSGHRTPPELAAKLVDYFNLKIDLAATAESCLEPLRALGLYLGPDRLEHSLRDALQVQWNRLYMDQPGFQRGFLNPPFSLEQIKQLRALDPPPADLQEQIDALRIEKWAEKACTESLNGFTTIGVFPYSPQTEWFRQYVLGLTLDGQWWGHAAYEYWLIPHRVSFLTPEGEKQNNAGVNTCIIHWAPNPGFHGPWQPPMRYWDYL